MRAIYFGSYQAVQYQKLILIPKRKKKSKIWKELWTWEEKGESAGETVRAGNLPIRELKMNLRHNTTYISKKSEKKMRNNEKIWLKWSQVGLQWRVNADLKQTNSPRLSWQADYKLSRRKEDGHMISYECAELNKRQQSELLTALFIEPVAALHNTGAAVSLAAEHHSLSVPTVWC